MFTIFKFEESVSNYGIVESIRATVEMETSNNGNVSNWF